MTDVVGPFLLLGERLLPSGVWVAADLEADSKFPFARLVCRK
jgi:hypothetical protein